MTLSLIFITSLWVLSVFSFARWRALIQVEKGGKPAPQQDLIFQVYLKVSGVIVIVWMMLMA